MLARLCKGWSDANRCGGSGVAIGRLGAVVRERCLLRPLDGHLAVGGADEAAPRQRSYRRHAVHYGVCGSPVTGGDADACWRATARAPSASWARARRIKASCRWALRRERPWRFKTLLMCDKMTPKCRCWTVAPATTAGSPPDRLFRSAFTVYLIRPVCDTALTATSACLCPSDVVRLREGWSDANRSAASSSRGSAATR